jgi:predicted RNase H-like nuclease
VDGAPGGWIVVRVGPGRVGWSVQPDAAAVLAATTGCVAVGVDIPLGLPAGPRRRACDEETAQALGPARSSVFPAPPRAVLTAASHAEACVIARQLTGRGISLQSFHIGPKVLDWDSLGERPATVFEVHPELAFRRLEPNVTFGSKKTARGAGQRIAALAGWVSPALALAELPLGARLDDALDALAAAWSAQRWARGEAEVLGLEHDDRGRPMCVVV